MNHLKIRKSFVRWFQERDHHLLPSASLIPNKDPSLLFINAGMNPLKNVFLGLQEPPAKKIISIQKCLRVGGKHNDLEQVGQSPFHHTFFEMMGNFTFGDYSKKTALSLAWEFLTEVLKIPQKNLWVSVFEEDKETHSLWREQGLASDRILKAGEKDNFWRMGQEGPCGPCSEIYYFEGISPRSMEDMMEVWNLVFMEFDEDSSGNKKPLPRLCVDTGIGLERLASVVQKKSNNYHTDLFSPLISSLSKKVGIAYEKNPLAFQVLADHSRATTFLISDGITPGNEGAHYVLRRLLRRAFHYNQKLSESQNLLPVAVKELIKQMKEVYPELKKEEDLILHQIEEEREKFFSNLQKGQKILLKKMQTLPHKVIDASTAWDLYSTYGFPLDLTRLMAEEKGWKIDVETEEEMLKQKQTSSFKKNRERETSLSPIQLKRQNIPLENTVFKGYETLKEESSVSKILSLSDLKTLTDLKKGEEAWVITPVTCFYPEGGGQIGDRGGFQTETAKGSISDCQKQENMIFHRMKVLEGTLRPQQKISLKVDRKHRFLVAGSHSATHLLHSTLKDVLGSSLKQAGSLVEAGRLRFDFTHPQPLTNQQIKKIEAQIQKGIEDQKEVSSSLLPYKQALKEGALSLAGENYPATVRVIQMGPLSKELCGGTHVSNTAEIGSFKIISETGVQSGIRRIEAYTGMESVRWLNFLAEQNLELREYLKIPKIKEEEKDSLLIKKIKKLEQEIRSLKASLKNTQNSGGNWEEAPLSQKSSLFILKSPLSDRKLLAEMADQKKSQKSSVVIVFGKKAEGYPIIITVSKDLQNSFSAHQILKGKLLPQLGGKGGGQARFAQGEVKQMGTLKQIQKIIKNSSS